MDAPLANRDRAMVLAMLLGALRRCGTLGLRMQDVRAGQRRLFAAGGKGGHERIAPVPGFREPACIP